MSRLTGGRVGTVTVASGVVLLSACGVDFVAPEGRPEPPLLSVRVFYEQPVEPGGEEFCARVVVTLVPGVTRSGAPREVVLPDLVVDEREISPYDTGGGRVYRYRADRSCGDVVSRLSLQPPIVGDVVWPMSTVHVPLALRGGEATVAFPRDEAVTLAVSRGVPGDWSRVFQAGEWRLSVEPAGGGASGQDTLLRHFVGVPPSAVALEPGELEGAPDGPLRATLYVQALGSAVAQTPVRAEMSVSIEGRAHWHLLAP